MRRQFKNCILSASGIYGPSLGAKVAAHLRGLGSILLMHRVVARKADSAACNLTITAAYLEAAIVHLRRAGAEFVALADMPGFCRAPRDGNRCVIALTFDDGYRDNLTLALPILRKHQVPATIFVPSGAPDRDMDVWFLRLERAIMSSSSIKVDDPALPRALPADNPFRKAETYRRLAAYFSARLADRRAHLEQILPQHRVSDEGLMSEHFVSWDDLRKVRADPLLTIGAHTVTHPVLCRLSETDALSEMVRGRSRLTSELDRDVRLFSYPYGGRTECGKREYRLARKAGFDLAVTTRYGNLHRRHQNHPFALPRITLGGLQENVAALMTDVFCQSMPRPPKFEAMPSR